MHKYDKYSFVLHCLGSSFYCLDTLILKSVCPYCCNDQLLQLCHLPLLICWVIPPLFTPFHCKILLYSPISEKIPFLHAWFATENVFECITVSRQSTASLHLIFLPPSIENQKGSKLSCLQFFMANLSKIVCLFKVRLYWTKQQQQQRRLVMNSTKSSSRVELGHWTLVHQFWWGGIVCPIYYLWSVKSCQQWWQQQQLYISQKICGSETLSYQWWWGWGILLWTLLC